MKLFFLTALLVITSYSKAQDNSSGVFLTMKPTKSSKGYTKIVSKRDGSKKFYVTMSPIIPAVEFVKVSEIATDSIANLTFFYVFFSQEGIDRFKAIIKKVEGSQLVLAVDNIVISQINEAGYGAYKSIQIKGPINSPDILWAQTALKKVVGGRK